MGNPDKKIAVLIIHGIGNQDPGYSSIFQKLLRKELEPRGIAGKIVCQEVCWQPLIQPLQEKLMSLYGKRIEWDLFRKFLLYFFSDATSYQMVPNLSKKTTFQLITREIHASMKALEKACGGDSPLVILAHSLGGFIISNYIWDRQKLAREAHVYGSTPFRRMHTLAGFVTFGCNIPLFALSTFPYKPIRVPSKEFKNGKSPGSAGRWLNIYDKDDVLGWPLSELGSPALKIMSPRYSRQWKAMVVDRQINAGRWYEKGNPLSHLGYWEDPDFLDQVAGFIGELHASL